jgi:hypothetical protein
VQAFGAGSSQRKLEEAKALAQVYNCDGFMRAMDEHSDGL